MAFSFLGNCGLAEPHSPICGLLPYHGPAPAHEDTSRQDPKCKQLRPAAAGHRLRVASPHRESGGRRRLRDNSSRSRRLQHLLPSLSRHPLGGPCRSPGGVQCTRRGPTAAPGAGARSAAALCAARRDGRRRGADSAERGCARVRRRPPPHPHLHQVPRAPADESPGLRVGRARSHTLAAGER